MLVAYPLVGAPRPSLKLVPGSRTHLVRRPVSKFGPDQTRPASQHASIVHSPSQHVQSCGWGDRQAYVTVKANDRACCGDGGLERSAGGGTFHSMPEHYASHDSVAVGTEVSDGKLRTEEERVAEEELELLSNQHPALTGCLPPLLTLSCTFVANLVKGLQTGKGREGGDAARAG